MCKELDTDTDFIKCEKCGCEIMMKIISRFQDDEDSGIVESGAVFKCPKCNHEKLVGNMIEG